MVNEHIEEFAGMKVAEYDPEKGIHSPEKTAFRLSVDWDESEEGIEWTDKLARLLEDPKAGQVAGLVIGPWGEVASGTDSIPVVEALAAAHKRLPNLRVLFFGDIVGEESEISWINQSDMTPLFAAYPNLEHLCLRGASQLSLGRMNLPKLRTLIIQSGGLPAEIVHSICNSQLPALEHLELWLGDEGYGASVTVEDLQPILSGQLFPRLRCLGLKNSEIQDEVAAAVAASPILERIRTLDLSMGTLGDEGLQKLLANPAMAKLELLDIHHHYASDEMVKRLQNAGINVDASDPEGPADADDRYVAVSE